MLILNADDTRKALPMKSAIAGMKSAYAAFCDGTAQVPLRTQLPVPSHAGNFIVMPSLVSDGSNDSLAVKIVSVYPNNPDNNLPTIHAVVLVFEVNSGRVLAMIEGGMLTAIRTGAASGAASDLLARPDSKTVAIFGAGIQAKTQLEAICAVRQIEKIWIYDINIDRAIEFMNIFENFGDPHPRIQIAVNPEEAISSADIICTATTSKIPVFAD
ncbi:MAG: hypothetical protein IZT55_06395, partial [Anaerolineae bacterium]|nr:hypothetical protein [Anaerolineae bacterium]